MIAAARLSYARGLLGTLAAASRHNRSASAYIRLRNAERTVSATRSAANIGRRSFAVTSCHATPEATQATNTRTTMPTTTDAGAVNAEDTTVPVQAEEMR